MFAVVKHSFVMFAYSFFFYCRTARMLCFAVKKHCTNGFGECIVYVCVCEPSVGVLRLRVFNSANCTLVSMTTYAAAVLSMNWRSVQLWEKERKKETEKEKEKDDYASERWKEHSRECVMYTSFVSAVHRPHACASLLCIYVNMCVCLCVWLCVIVSVCDCISRIHNIFVVVATKCTHAKVIGIKPPVCSIIIIAVPCRDVNCGWFALCPSTTVGYRSIVA